MIFIRLNNNRAARKDLLRQKNGLNHYISGIFERNTNGNVAKSAILWRFLQLCIVCYRAYSIDRDSRITEILISPG